MKSSLTRFFLFLLLLTAFAGLILFPEEAASAAREGLDLCAGVIVPALFPFLVLSSLTVSLGMTAGLGRLLAPLMKPLFGVGAAGAGALVLGLVGGYPVGAKTVRQLRESGQCSPAESQRLLAFCNNCGPAFLLGIAGGRVFGSAAIGGLLWLAHFLGAITVGLLFRNCGNALNEDKSSFRSSCSVGCITLPDALTGAVQSGLRSTLNICAYVILFRVLLRFTRLPMLSKTLCLIPNGTALLNGLLELSGGITALDPALKGALPLASFLLGFGGLSVWCQTIAMLEGSGLSCGTALLGKVLHGAFAALWTVLLTAVFPYAVPTAAFSALPLAAEGLFWLPLAVSGGSWGIFLLWGWYFFRFDGRKSRKNQV